MPWRVTVACRTCVDQHCRNVLTAGRACRATINIAIRHGHYIIVMYADACATCHRYAVAPAYDLHTVPYTLS